MKFLLRYPLYLIPFFVVACSTSPKGPAPSVQALENANAAAFFGDNTAAPSSQAFNLAARTAIGGNNTELAYLMALAQFAEGDGVKAYGAYLNEMQALIGQVRFNEVLSRIPYAQQLTVKTMMAEAPSRISVR